MPTLKHSTSTTNENASATLSSKNSPKLKLEFFESGIGETIVVTFPSGDLAVVDAHPSQHTYRPGILEIVKGKRIRFVCLTHPHADHGADLVPILQEHPEIDEFWHTIYDVPALIYGMEQAVNFPSAIRGFASKMNQDWGAFLIDVYGAVVERKIPRHQLRSDVQPRVIDGVEIHCLSPEEAVHNEFFVAYHKKLQDPSIEVPDPNLLSAVLAFKFGEGVVLLAADALKRNWATALKRYRAQSLPKARIMKIPHHGAKNAFDLKRDARSYLDICVREPRAKGVLFAGDSKHPDDQVYKQLLAKTDLACLSNGRKPITDNTNPLRLQLMGARAALPAPLCNPVVAFEMDEKGEVRILAGAYCHSGGCVPKSEAA